MKLSISEIAKLTNISVRTLHYYDEINLLKPKEVDENGYRYYDENSLEILQTILFYKELQFSLKDISKIISNPDFDRKTALINQKNLLQLKKKRLEKIINLVDDILKGDNNMSFKEFDNTEFEKERKKYEEETQKLYGHTDEYKESARRTKKYTKEDWSKIKQEADEIMQGFYQKQNLDVNDAEVVELVEVWKNHISKYYYKCTNEILRGLGLMYVNDERFKNNIDMTGEGTAEFMSKAIENYCNKTKL